MITGALASGLTVTVAVTGVPGQPLAVGVMVKVTVTGAPLLLVSVPLMLLPAPLTGIPNTAGLSLVQLKVVPGTLEVSTIVEIAEPEQIVWLDGVAVATGTGLTVMVCEAVAVQPKRLP